MCFARALLRKTKILVLDEATSSIDLETDEAVQEILRGDDFKGVTTLTVSFVYRHVNGSLMAGQIAHRINTILDSDRCLVMSDGKVAEFDTPDKLMADSVRTRHRENMRTRADPHVVYHLPFASGGGGPARQVFVDSSSLG